MLSSLGFPHTNKEPSTPTKVFGLANRKETAPLCRSPLTKAFMINELEKDLFLALGELTKKKEAFKRDLDGLLQKSADEGTSNAGIQERKSELESMIAEVDTEMNSVHSGKLAEYLSLDLSIGSNRLADIAKIEKAASLFTRVKVTIILLTTACL
jgi:hypothetical protein